MYVNMDFDASMLAIERHVRAHMSIHTYVQNLTLNEILQIWQKWSLWPNDELISFVYAIIVSL